MKRWLVVTIAAVGLMAADICLSCLSWEHVLAMSGEDAVILDTRYDVVVAVITTNATPNGTNGNPPLLLLEVIEVLRGELNLDRGLAVWAPFYDGGTGEQLKKWKASPLPGPISGQKFVLAGEMKDHGGQRVFRISAIGRFEFDSERYDWAVKTIRKAPILRAEQEQYRDAWPRWFAREELLDGARPVTNETDLELGQPILMRWATLWQGRVVGLLPDGRVRVRPKEKDSRWDQIEDRDRLLLYPKRLLEIQSDGSDRPYH